MRSILPRSWTRIACAALALAGLAGCISSPAVVVDTAAPQSAPLAATANSGFSAGPAAVPVRPRDKLSVQVLREPDLSLADVRVGEDGYFDMPQIGRVRAEGRSTAEISEEIRERLAQDYLVNPRVAVNVVDYASHTVAVEGAVVQPGIYQFQPKTTLVGAVALARGPSRVAKLNQVAIFRQQNGARSVAVFDLRQVRAGRMIDPEIHPGDRVLIGHDGMQQAWLDILAAAPLLAVFTNY